MAEQQHRCTAEDWRTVEKSDHLAEFSCLLELLHRIEALEATQHAHVDLSHLSDAEQEKILKLLANPGRFEVLEVAQPAQPNYPEKPDSSLLERVAFAITGDSDGPINWKPEARAAIREVAAWLREQKVYGVGWVWAVERLEEEAER